MARNLTWIGIGVLGAAMLGCDGTSADLASVESAMRGKGKGHDAFQGEMHGGKPPKMKDAHEPGTPPEACDDDEDEDDGDIEGSPDGMKDEDKGKHDRKGPGGKHGGKGHDGPGCGPGQPDHKVQVCHRRKCDKPPLILEVDKHAIPAHLAHGDTLVEPESCNGKDDDCDGEVDEDGVCTPEPCQGECDAAPGPDVPVVTDVPAEPDAPVEPDVPAQPDLPEEPDAGSADEGPPVCPSDVCITPGCPPGQVCVTRS